MMKNFLFAFIFIVGVFILPGKVKAEIFPTIPAIATGTPDTFSGNGINTGWVYDNYTFPGDIASLFPAPTASHTLYSLKMTMKFEGTCPAGQYDINVGIPFVSGSGSWATITTNYADYTFDLSSFNLTLNNFFRINLAWGFSPHEAPPAGCDLKVAHYKIDSASESYIKSIQYDNGNLYNIQFKSNFTDYMTVPDFRQWDLLLTIPDTAINPGWGVLYKHASSTTDFDFSDGYILNHAPSEASNATYLPLVKNHALAPGDYLAYAYLNDNFDTVATSSILHFTINTSTPILTPGSESQPNGGFPPGQMYDDSWCKETAFSVWGADFGKGLCVVFSFLFVPGQNVVDTWASVQDNLQIHAPFSYFYQMSSIFTNLAPTATSSPTLTLTTGTSTPINVNFTALSPDTFNKYTTTGSRAIIRNLIKYFLYLIFAFMVMIEVRHLFKPGGGGKVK